MSLDPSSIANNFAFISHNMSTFPHQQPKIDNAQLARRKRRRTSPTELSILEVEFNINSRPDREKRKQIASKVNMNEKAVQIWFQNKRQSCRKKKHVLIEIPSASSSPSLSSCSKSNYHDDELNYKSKDNFEIFQDPISENEQNSLKLSISEKSGKAVVIKRNPISKILSIKNDSDENKMSINTLISASSPIKTKTIKHGENTLQNINCRDQMEVECISNLLSLRWGN